jgi:hypothetical protein
MGWTATLIMLAGGLVLTLYQLIFTRKRKESLQVPVIPPTAILFLGVLLIMIAGSHALTLLGIEHNRSQLRLH